MAYTNSWDETTPTDSTPANTIDDLFRAVKIDIRERIGGLLGIASWTGVDPLVIGNISIGGTLGVTGAATLSSTLNVVGNLSVATNKFTVLAASGNTAIAGTLGVTSNTTLSGTLGVTGATSLAALTATTGSFSSTLNVVGNFSVNTNKFNVTAASGNTTAAGTLGVTGATTLSSTLGVTGVATFSNTLTASGTIFVDGAAGTNRLFRLQTASSNRWAIFADTSPESGGNVGSRLAITAYDDTGVAIDTPVTLVRTAGGTFSIVRPVVITGTLSVSSTITINNNSIFISGAAGGTRSTRYQTVNVDRWGVGAGSSAESGGNTGSEFVINAFTDAGAYQDTAISIARATNGIISIARPVVVSNTLTTTGFVAAAGSLASNTPAQITQTWNNVAVAFTGLLISITNTTSSAASSPLQVNVGGSKVFGVDVNGTITAGSYQATQITDNYLATISTAGKVSNSATTATNTNTISTIVARDGSGNFSAGTITANLTGIASSSTKLQTARLINGVSFDGTADISITAAADAGTLTGTTLAATVVTSSLTSIGTLTSLALNGNLTFSGVSRRIIPGTTDIGFRNNANSADNLLITDAGNITVRGTLSGVTTLTATTVAGTLSTAAQANITSVGSLTSLTIAGNLTFSGASRNIIAGTTNLSIRNNANSADNLLITDAGAITVRGTISGVTTLTVTTVTATTLTGTLSSAAQTGITSVGTLTSLLVNTGTIASSTPVDITSTWNAGGITFKAFTINITNTASAGTSSLVDFKVGGASVFTVSPAGVISNASLSGNASTATVLQTARNINGVSFNGSADITITAAADAGTLTGTTLAAAVVTSSLTSIGTLTSLALNGNLTFSGASRRIIPGATSLVFRNTANGADNLVINDNGDMSFRGALSGITTLNATTVGATTLTGTIGTAAQTSITSVGTLTALLVASGSLGASAPIDISQTWNAAGVTFKALTLTISDTASQGGSKLVDMIVGGSSRFNIDKSGNITGTSISLATATFSGKITFSAASGVIPTSSWSVRNGGDTGDLFKVDIPGNAITALLPFVTTGSVTIGGNLDIASSSIVSASNILAAYVSGTNPKIKLGSSSVYAQVTPIANASLAGSGAANDGIITIDSTNNRICYYSGGSRYFLAGTSF